MKKIIFISIVILILIIAIHLYRKNKALQGLEDEFDEEYIFVKDESTGKEKQIKLLCSGWFEPYDERGHTNLNKLTKKRFGIYFIKSKRTGEIIYIGHSKSNLYKALYRHFQYYNDTDKQERFYYPQKGNYLVKVCLTYKKDAYEAERYYINLLEPRDAIKKYGDLVEQKEIDLPMPDNIEWEIEETEDVFAEDLPAEDLPM